MKKFFIAFAAFATALMMTVSCDEITDEQKDGLTKVLVAGEYGVISMTGTDGMGGFDADLLTDDAGRPVMIWAMSLDGSCFIANNKAWRVHTLDGTWDVSGMTLTMSYESYSKDESYEIISFESGLLKLRSGQVEIVLKRLTDADKCPQLQSVNFTGLDLFMKNGKVVLDPRIQFTDGYYQLTWEYDPADYEPYLTPAFESSDPDVATVNADGRISMKPGVTSGETTITLTCDGVAVSVTLQFIVIN